MNILNLLTTKRHIVGIEISDSVIRVAYSKPKQKSEVDKNLPSDQIILKEEPLPSGIVSSGVVKEKESLVGILKNIWVKENLEKSYAVVSVQEDKVYSHILSFPRNIDEIKLKEAVTLAIDFQIPIKKEDYYIGWEMNGDSNTTNKVLVSAMPKNIVNDYTKVLESAGINVLALESHLSSISRSIKANDKSVLIIKENSESTTLFCLNNNIFQFSRTIPKAIIKEENYIANEISKIKNALESDSKKQIEETPLTKGEVIEEYLKYPEIKNTGEPSKWLIPIGALIRGEIPQGKDNKISLLPIGTAEAYSFQKIKIFATLVRNIVIGVSVFFLITFIASYIFILSISQSINAKKNKINISPISSNIIEKESLIKKINALTLVSDSFLQTSPNWSLLIDEINAKTIEGITISNFRAQSITETMSITGISKDRETLNKFKESLEQSAYLSEVELPITNLEQKGDIPFSISFKIKDPSMLYFK